MAKRSIVILMFVFVMLMPVLSYAQGNGGTKKKKQKTEQTQSKKKKQTQSNTAKPRQESQRQVKIQRQQEAEAQRQQEEETQRKRVAETQRKTLAKFSQLEAEVSRQQEEETQRQCEAEEVTRRSQIGEINGYEYVDLGLPSGLKWATCNAGATSPEESGDYFAWGEISTKSEYSFSTCITYDKSESELQTSGIVDYAGRLTLSHDAAHTRRGASWRIPTVDEFKELKDKCSWKWSTHGATIGYEITGPNGQSIFLPAAARRYGTSSDGRGITGFYWSSTPLAGRDRSFSLYFNVNAQKISQSFRDEGFTIRPVSD